MGSLIGKLDLLLQEASEEDDPQRMLRLRLRLPRGFKDNGLVHLLKEDLEEISTNLVDLSEMEDPPLMAKCWMKEARELFYDIEDYIDSYAWPAARARSSKTKTRSIRKMMSSLQLSRLPRKKKLTYNKRVTNKISEFRIRAQDVSERYNRYQLDCHNSLRRRYEPVGPMLPTTYEEGADLVIDGRQMSHLMDTLSLSGDGDHQLKVVSVVGSGGIGKTTLVGVLYNKIRGQFDCRAFVRMTRKPDMNKILRDILTQIQRHNQRYDDSEDLDLIAKIRKHLQDKRYLIVIDDLWASQVWTIITHAFPEGSQGSRIIITTQIEDIALACCSYHSEFVLEMRPLDSYYSRKLFFNRIFSSESECPDTFKEVSNKIIELCGGLPLATISMASLLASYPVMSIEQLTYVSDSLSSSLRTSSGSEGVRLVLNLSYNNLTHHLKTCLLYLNMYPEGYTIYKDDLVRQWVAEGFIDEVEGQEVERVAGSYFDELIDRRFLQPAFTKYNDELVSCMVHDIVQDLIAYKSAEENFVMVLDNYRNNVELCDKVHRLSLHFGDAMRVKKPGNIGTSQVRSLSFSGFFTCMPCITEFKLLRVLNLQLSSHHGEDILDVTGISELVHLKYFKVGSDAYVKLPKHMQGLHYLQTLDMDTKITAVPWDIIYLPCLFHLHLHFDTNLLDWIGSMRSASVQKFDKLTNLRDLRITCSTTAPPDHLGQNMEKLGSLLSGLRNLKTLALVPSTSHQKALVHSPSKEVNISWHGFTPPVFLQRFEWSPCSCTFSRVPKWIRELRNLCILKIAVRELLRNDVDILKGLPVLTVLSLYLHSVPTERIVFDKTGFSVLKYFKFRCSAPRLKFEADAMPNLSKLKLGFNAHRADEHGSTNISIEHLPGLKDISVKIGGAGADAESALTASITNHPSNPQIDILSVDWVFYGDEVRNTAIEKKEDGTIEPYVIVREETGLEFSGEDVEKQTEEEEQKTIEQKCSYEKKRKTTTEEEEQKTIEQKCSYEKKRKTTTPRRQLQGPRPPRLNVRMKSHAIKKPSSGSGVPPTAPAPPPGQGRRDHPHNPHHRRRLVPKLPAPALLDEAADYVAALQMQVSTMRALADALAAAQLSSPADADAEAEAKAARLD